MILIRKNSILIRKINFNKENIILIRKNLILIRQIGFLIENVKLISSDLAGEHFEAILIYFSKKKLFIFFRLLNSHLYLL